MRKILRGITAALCAISLLVNSTAFADSGFDTVDGNVVDDTAKLVSGANINEYGNIPMLTALNGNEQFPESGNIGKTGTNVTYSFNSETGELTISGNGEMADYKSDNAIGDNPSPFYKNEKIRSVIIKSGVTNIGDGVFHTCKNLQNIEIPDSVTSIGYRSFANCANLISLTLPKTLTYIGKWSFDSCSGLTEIVIPESVVTIDSHAFYHCNSLTSISIPASVKLNYDSSQKIYNGSIFYECENLKEVTLYNDRVTPSMFYCCSSLETVNLEGNLERIDSGAFYGCKNLKKIVLPQSVSEIGSRIFYGCSSLEEITIPNMTSKIPKYAFDNCSKLKTIILPESVTSIDDAFYKCNALSDIYYRSSKENWEKITINNNKLKSEEVTIHYLSGTITLNPTEGTFDGEQSKIIEAWQDEAIGELPTPTRDNYTFNGWYTAENGGEKVTAETVFNEDTTVYAQWTRNQYTVTFDANGGVLTDTTGTTDDNFHIAVLPEPARSGFTFNGWYTAENGGEKVIAETVFNEDTTVYAHWTLNQYTITFDANGGVLTDTTGTTDDNFHIAVIPEPARSGFTFDGWYTEKEGGTKITADSVFTENTTIYAHWINNTENDTSSTRPKPETSPNPSLPYETPSYDQNHDDVIMSDMDHEDVSEPTAADSAVPFIKDISEKQGWDMIKSEIETANSGDVITVDMNGATVVPENVLVSVKERDIALVFEMGGGISWTVNGLDITAGETGDIDFKVTVNTKNIPAETVNDLAKGQNNVQINIAHNGAFGFTAILSIYLGEENAGNSAVLYYYNNGVLEPMYESEIANDGTAQLIFRHASDYLIIIDKKVSENKETDSSAEPDSSVKPDNGTETADSVPADNKTSSTANSGVNNSDNDNPQTGEADKPWKAAVIGSLLTTFGLLFPKSRKKKTK